MAGLCKMDTLANDRSHGQFKAPFGARALPREGVCSGWHIISSTMSKQLYHYKRDGKGKGKRESSSTTHHPARGEGVHSLCRCTDGQYCQHFPRMRECAAIQVYANLNSASSIEFALMLKYPRRRYRQNEHIRHLEARYNLLLLSLFWTSLTASRSIIPHRTLPVPTRFRRA